MTKYRMGKRMTISMIANEEKKARMKKANCVLELTAKLSKAETIKDKREVIANEMGFLFYAFGKTIKPYKPWLSYEENMNEPDWRVI